MAFSNLWDHQFCLACDKQVQVDGDAYCSESCRLAEFERTSSSSPASEASSPGFATSAYTWSSTPQTTSQAKASKLYLSPAYDFSNAQPYGTTPVQYSAFSNYHSTPRTQRPSSQTSEPTRNLTSSSSHSSLCSIQSNSSTESSNLSDVARRELQAYAVSFEHVRNQRRRSQ